MVISVIHLINAGEGLFFTPLREEVRSSIFKSFFRAVTVHGFSFKQSVMEGEIQWHGLKR
jgi:hypothetical protein